MTERLGIFDTYLQLFQTLEIMEKTLSDKNEPNYGLVLSVFYFVCILWCGYPWYPGISEKISFYTPMYRVCVPDVPLLSGNIRIACILTCRPSGPYVEGGVECHSADIYR